MALSSKDGVNGLFSAANLFKAAALLNAISIPGHTMMGYDHVHPAIGSIPSGSQTAIGKRGAQSAWNYVNASLLVAALLNYQWSRTHGPRTTEEKAMLATLMVAGWINSCRYIQVGAYPPLVCLAVAPACSLLGYLKS